MPSVNRSDPCSDTVFGNSLENEESRKWAETSGLFNITRPAGFDSEAVASSASAMKLAPIPSERAPGGEKLNCVVNCGVFGGFGTGCADADAEIKTRMRQDNNNLTKVRMCLIISDLCGTSRIPTHTGCCRYRRRWPDQCRWFHDGVTKLQSETSSATAQIGISITPR